MTIDTTGRPSSVVASGPACSATHAVSAAASHVRWRSGLRTRVYSYTRAAWAIRRARKSCQAGAAPIAVTGTGSGREVSARNLDSSSDPVVSSVSRFAGSKSGDQTWVRDSSLRRYRSSASTFPAL
jgi:hypothetical protein